MLEVLGLGRAGGYLIGVVGDQEREHLGDDTQGGRGNVGVGAAQCTAQQCLGDWLRREQRHERVLTEVRSTAIGRRASNG